ncbi:hypothetical protein AB0M28_35720 [Streptomyces sp. NPDC051940]|uniref:hypothetical protein n=1 Tax=Streptomyces sp. NPDC051940 TaxID=3155675 RepID=UPI00341D0C5A
MSGRRQEHVPFSFIAEADRFRSNVAPPRRRHATSGQMAGRSLVGLLVAGGLVGALFFGMPALQSAQPGSGTAQQTETGSTQP